MPEFLIKAGASINFELPARYILIDSVTAGKSVILKGRSGNLDFEYNVRGGGKLSNLHEVVTQWVIKNENSIDVDVVLQGGEILYDENRLDGDVNSLTRPANLTLDKNQFFKGETLIAIVGQFSVFGLINKAGSGKKVYISKIKNTCFGVPIYIERSTEAAVAADLGGVIPLENKMLNEVGATAAEFRIGYPVAAPAGSSLALFETTASGEMVSISFDNSPIEIGEGEAVTFIPGSSNNKNSIYLEVFEE